jgi:hypothetical protein
MFLRKELIVEMVSLFADESDQYTTIVLLTIVETIMTNNSHEELRKIFCECLNNTVLSEGCSLDSSSLHGLSEERTPPEAVNSKLDSLPRSDRGRPPLQRCRA